MIQRELYLISSSDLTPASLFIFSLLESLFDSYLRYRDTQSGYYFPRYTQEWELPESIWLAIKYSYLSELVSIPEEFIQQFVQLWLSELETSFHLSEYDRIAFLQCWIYLSLKDKMLIMEYLPRLYNEWRVTLPFV